MSFRRALLAFALCALGPAVASAEEARVIQGGYEITFAGFSGFRMDFTARFDGNRYDVESSTFKEGVLKAITMNYQVRNRAWGAFSPQGARAAALCRWWSATSPALGSASTARAAR